MSRYLTKKEIIWNWFLGIFLTLGNLFLLAIYAITKDYSAFQIPLAIIFLIYGIFKISEMLYYTTENNK